MIYEDLEAFFLNHDEPIIERMEAANNRDGAVVIGVEALEEQTYRMRDLHRFVDKIRGGE